MQAQTQIMSQKQFPRGTKKVLRYSVAFIFFFVFFSSLVNAQSNWLWGRSSDTPHGASIQGSASDDSGNVYLTGSFTDTIAFGPYTLTGASTNCFYLVKYNSAGTVIWARTVPANDFVIGYAVACDKSLNVFVTGTFKASMAVFGPDTLTNSPGVTTDIFLAKFSSNGTPLWAKSFGGAQSESVFSICCDLAGNAYFTGGFSTSQVQFGSYTLQNFSSASIYLAKSDPAGTILWANAGKDMLFNGNSSGISVCYGGLGNIYLAANGGGPWIAFGNDTIFNPHYTSGQFLLVKFDAQGNFIWGKCSPDDSGIIAYDMAVDNQENAYITGRFEDTTYTFGSIVLFNSYFNNPNNQWISDAMFLVKYDSSGTVAWALAPGGDSDPTGTSVEMDIYDNVYVCGMMGLPAPNFVVFGNDTLLPNYNNVNDRSAFLVAFDPQGNELDATVTRVGGQYSSFLAADRTSNAMYFSGYAFTWGIFGPDTLQGVSIPVYVFVAKWHCAPASVNQLSPLAALPVSVYPNPSNGAMTISFELDQPDEVQVSVLDMQGRMLFIFPEKNYAAGKYNLPLDLGEIPSGMYLLRLNAGSGISRQVIVKAGE